MAFFVINSFHQLFIMLIFWFIFYLGVLESNERSRLTEFLSSEERRATKALLNEKKSRQLLIQEFNECMNEPLIDIISSLLDYSDLVISIIVKITSFNLSLCVENSEVSSCNSWKLKFERKIFQHFWKYCHELA